MTRNTSDNSASILVKLGELGLKFDDRNTMFDRLDYKLRLLERDVAEDK